MTIVVDSSVVVAALVDSGPAGIWAEEILASDALAAPHLLPVEVGNALRLLAQSDLLSADIATLAHADLEDLTIELFPYSIVSDRAWSLRQYLSSHDAWYVGLAELLGAGLATLDGRLASAPGPRCAFQLPDR